MQDIKSKSIMCSLLAQALNLWPGQLPGLKFWLSFQLRIMREEHWGLGPALSSDPALGRTGGSMSSPCLGSGPHG